jgi:hypothetical protein
MGRIIGILIALLPFALAWAGPILSTFGNSSIPQSIAEVSLLQKLSWTALLLGAFIALLNAFLSFIRPLFLNLRGIPPEEQHYVSGIPILASFLLMLSTIALHPELWPCFAVSAFLLLDTGGPLWFLIYTWKDDSVWRKDETPTTK